MSGTENLRDDAINAFSETSMDFFMHRMTHAVNRQKFHEVKQDVLLQIGDIVRRHGAAIAFPTRTLDQEAATDLPVPEPRRDTS